MKKTLFALSAFLLIILAPVSDASNVASSYMPSGMIFAFAGVSCPSGSVAADGSSLTRTGINAPLYSALGTQWGAVDGTHFTLPDLRGQFMRGSTTTMAGGLISALPGSNEATISAHGFNHSGIPIQITGTPPSGLSTATTYYIIYVDANTVQFASTLANALSATAISISGSTGGNVVQWVDPDSGSRVAQAISGATTGVGSQQTDQLASHTHTVQGFLANQAASGVIGGIQGPSTTTGATGGNETRSKNAYVQFCIKL